MAMTRDVEATVLPDFNASWSNRNGGELLLTGGSMRLVVSAAWAQGLVDKISRALDVPKRAASLVDARDDRPVVPEPERIADVAPSVREPLSQRRGWLGARFPLREKRLAALRHAIAEAGPMADFVSVGSILFTLAEAQEIADALALSVEPY